MVSFTTIVVITAILLNIDDIQAAPVLQSYLNIQCRARTRELDVLCQWQTPPSLGENETCSLYYMMTPGHPNSVEECAGILDWTECVEGEINSCFFPAYPNSFTDPSVFGSCGPNIDMKVTCTDGHSSDVLTVNNYNITLPDPIENLNVLALSGSEVSVKWDKPQSWHNDLGLIFVIEYWQEHSNITYKIIQKQMDLMNVYTEKIHENLLYADTVTCVRVAGYFHLNPLKTLSDWSEPSCTKTLMDAPRAAPTNIQEQTILVDWETETRKVNITWDPIPVHLQGGPILEYTIKMCHLLPESNCVESVYNVSNQTHYILVLNPLSSYKIDIRARNEVGPSSFAEYSISGLTLTHPESSSLPYYLGIVAACVIVLVVLISSLLVLRKKMRASHLPPIELHEKSLTVVIKPVQKEEEVFDSLKPRSQVSAIDKRGADSSRYLERMRDSTTPLLQKNGHVLQKLDLNGEHMPLVEDADLYSGEVSPTDSGLQCDDFLMESQGEPSPIPMSFPPGNSPSRRINLDNLNSEQVDLPPERRDDTSRISLGSSPSDSGQSGEGYVLQALANEDGELQAAGNDVTDESAYNDGSVISSIGYVQTTTPDNNPGNDGHNSPYVAQAPILNNGAGMAESSIESYVQQGAAETSQDGSNRLDNSTSGNSSCPTYVKQSEANA